jgi:hypothetical protein
LPDAVGTASIKLGGQPALVVAIMIERRGAAMAGGLALGALVFLSLMLAHRWLDLEPTDACHENHAVRPVVQSPAQEPEIGALDLAPRIR